MRPGFVSRDANGVGPLVLDVMSYQSGNEFTNGPIGALR